MSATENMLTTAQKKALHRCHVCGHLLDSHAGSPGCTSCWAEQVTGSNDVCRRDPRLIETTYEDVAVLLAAARAEGAAEGLRAAADELQSLAEGTSVRSVKGREALADAAEALVRKSLRRAALATPPTTGGES